MAIMPCDVDKRRYKGPAQTAYVMTAVGGEMSRWKIRMCPVHMSEHHELVSAQMNLVDETTAADLDGHARCMVCGVPLRADEGAIVWAKVYPRGHVEEEFFAKSCLGCLPQAKHTVSMGAVEQPVAGF